MTLLGWVLILWPFAALAAYIWKTEGIAVLVWAYFSLVMLGTSFLAGIYILKASGVMS